MVRTPGAEPGVLSVFYPSAVDQQNSPRNTTSSKNQYRKTFKVVLTYISSEEVIVLTLGGWVAINYTESFHGLLDV